MNHYSASYGHWKKLPKESGVYVVWSGSTCLYVGSSKNVRRRLTVHNKHQIFVDNKATHVDIVPCGLEELSFLENQTVYKLRPKLNIYAHNAGKKINIATGKHKKCDNSKLRDATLRLLHNRRHSVTLKHISEQTGLSERFLSNFSRGVSPNPGVNSVECLYEYLSGKALDV